MWCLGLSCLFQVFPRVLLSITDPRGRLGGKVESACEQFEDNEDGILG